LTETSRSFALAEEPNGDIKPGEERRDARSPDGRAATDVVSAAGDQATAFVILGSIVIPLAILTAVCWFFWKHRHDD